MILTLIVHVIFFGLKVFKMVLEIRDVVVARISLQSQNSSNITSFCVLVDLFDELGLNPNFDELLISSHFNNLRSTAVAKM